MSNLQAALLTILVTAAAIFFVFGGSVPGGRSPFVLKAAFTSNTYIHIPSPVRIAGVDVGSVTGVTRLAGGSGAGVLTMEINPDGLPIHADATAALRERIFLEGNVYVDLQPGSPSAPVVQSGYELPVSHTSGPVQLDRVLSSLTAPARANLQTLVRGLGAALNAPPTAAQDATQDPSVRGLTGGQALNASLQYSAQAFEASAIVNQALLGSAPDDLSGAVAGAQRVFRGFASSGPALASLVHTFNATMATLASEQQALSASIAALPPLERSAIAADAALDASFAPTQAFARQVLPGIRILDPTIGDALPWLAQLTALNSKPELGTLLHELTPSVQATSQALPSTTQLLSLAGELALCLTHNVIPTGNAVIQDPPNTTGLQVYQELFQSAVGIAGASQNFDGNGRYVRATVAGGSQQIVSKHLPINGPLYGNAVLAPLGTRPALGGAPPPLKRSLACYRNPAPNLGAAATGAGP